MLVLIIPSRIYIKLECELDSSKKNEKLNDLELQEVKNQFSIKVKKLNNTIESIFKTLDNMSENENLNFKSKSAGLIENLSNNTTGSLALIKYKSYFLRAMAKIALNDKSAINDLEKINKEQHVIVSDESLRLYRKQLGIK